MIGEADHSAQAPAREDEPPQKLLARDEGRIAQVVSVAIKQIEDIIGHRRLRNEVCRGHTDMHPLLKPLEVAVAALIERDDLPVQEGAPGMEQVRQRA